MVDNYELRFTDLALKDAHKIKRAGLEKKVQQLLDVIRVNPYQTPPRYERLVGNLKGAYSRRINLKHRLVYSVDENEHFVRVLRMWSHYGDN
ncbi:MAG: Txe/YoeB family addiction module toxin [Candidatus Ancillula sp.]|nr:Txe/YoeB family addiction module toxin [Candidatus Ancillula sp.]